MYPGVSRATNANFSLWAGKIAENTVFLGSMVNYLALRFSPADGASGPF